MLALQRTQCCNKSSPLNTPTLTVMCPSGQLAKAWKPQVIMDRVRPQADCVPQVLKLCRKHRLLSALVYMFTRGLQDFIAPAVELLMAQVTEPSDASAQPLNSPAAIADAADAGTAEQGSESKAAPLSSRRGADGYKLLVYLRCCLQGQQFPPGAGPLPAPQASITKAATLGMNRHD